MPSLYIITGSNGGNSLKHLERNFSGYIEYKDWSGKIKFVLRITKGIQVAKYNVTQSHGPTPVIQSTLKTFDISCESFDVPYGETNCVMDAEGNLTNCITMIDGYYTYYFCYDTGSYPDGSVPQPDADYMSMTLAVSQDFNLSKVFNSNGPKPIGEFPNRCAGAQDMWQRSINTNKEVFGAITIDGKFLTIAVVGQSGGSVSGLYTYEHTTYFTYPDNLGAPSQSYQGMIHSAGQYFIPIAATVHTHTPCLQDGSDGISNSTLSQGDQNLDSAYPNIYHFIIGCDAVGRFDRMSTSPTLLNTGPLSTTCSSLQ